MIFQEKHHLEAVITDLDGSLFDVETQKISEQDLRTVKRLKTLGIPVFIATGRHFEFCIQHAYDMGFDCPTVCSNGAQIYDFEAKQALYEDPIPVELVKSIENHLFEQKIKFIAYTDVTAFFSKDNPRADFWKRVVDAFEPRFRTTLTYIDASFPLWDYAVYKFLLPYATPEIDTSIREVFNSQNEMEMTNSAKNFLDINAKGASKGNALRFLAERYGFDLDHTLAIGDNDNDKSMMDICGYPVAPEGAEEDVKENACFVTASCGDSPLTRAIQELFPQLLSQK